MTSAPGTRPAHAGFETWRKLAEQTAGVLTRTLEKPWPKTTPACERRARKAVAELHGAGATLRLSKTGTTAASLTLTAHGASAAEPERLTIGVTADPETGELTYGASFIKSEEENAGETGTATPSADQIEGARDAIASIARSAMAIAHGSYEQWIAWRYTTNLFENAEEAARCAATLLKGIKTVEEWTKTEPSTELDALGRALHDAGCAMHLEYDPGGKLTNTALSAPIGTPGILRTGNDQDMFRTDPPTEKAVIALSRKPNSNTWKPVADRQGVAALLILETQPGTRKARRRAAMALKAIARHADTAPQDTDTASAARHRPVITTAQWITGTTVSRPSDPTAVEQPKTASGQAPRQSNNSRDGTSGPHAVRRLDENTSTEIHHSEPAR